MFGGRNPRSTWLFMANSAFGCMIFDSLPSRSRLLVGSLPCSNSLSLQHTPRWREVLTAAAPALSAY